MPFQCVNQVNFHYELLGKASSQQPIVFISGFTCDINQWRDLATIVAQDRQVLIFDNQGIGLTKDDGQPLSVAQMAENIKALIDSLGLQKSIIAGYALGAGIALTIAQRYPNEVSQQCLLSAVMKFNPQAQAICEQLCAYREQHRLAEYSDLIYQTGFGKAYKNKTDINAFRAFFVPYLQNCPQSMTDQRRQVQALKNYDASHWLSEITTPTMVISPEEDQFCLPSESSQLANHLLNAERFTIKHSGHAALVEQFDTVKSLFMKHCLQ